MKKNIIRVLIIIFLMMPICVFASSSVEFSGVVLTTKDSTVTYSYKISTDEQISKLEATLEYDKEVFELVSITGETNWKSLGEKTLSFESEIDYSSYSQNADGTLKEKESFNVAKVVFKVLKDNTTSSIKVTNIKALNQDEEEVDLSKNELSKNVTIKSSDNNLKSLSINDDVIELQEGVLEYTMEVDATIEKVAITAVKNSNLSEFVSGFGSRTEDLKYGENEILIKLKSEAGTTKTYIIKVTREDDRNSNSDLKSIIINSGTIEFDSSKLATLNEYRIYAYELDKIEITAEPYDAKSVVEIIYPKEIVIGDNLVTIKVTSESGKEKEYYLHFINENELTSTFLKELKIEGYDNKLNFNKNTNDYTIILSYKYKTTKIMAVAESESVTLLLNGDEITSGVAKEYELKENSTIEIKVMPNNGSTENARNYTIHIEKDTSINFYLILEVVISIILIICNVAVLIKRKKLVKKLKQV